MARPTLVTPLLWSSLGLSLACGLAAQGLLALDPAAFTVHWFRQPVLLVALHLSTLGFVGLMIVGVLTQFLPMLLGRGLGSTALVGAALAVFGLGLLLLLGVFAGWRAQGPAWAGGLALLGGSGTILVLAWPALVHRGARQRLCRANLASSLFYLVLTAGLGTLMAQGLVGSPRLPTGPLDLIRLHAHLGLLGFGCLMVFAVSYELLPMFNLAKGYPLWPGWLALGLAHTGLLALATDVLGGFATLGPPAESLLALACLSYTVQVGWIQAKAFRPQRDASGWLFRWACLALVAAAFWAAGLAWRGSAPAGDVAAAVYLVLFGFLGGAIASQLQKIVPLMAWVDRFSTQVGKSQVPVAGQLLHQPLAWIALGLHGLALLSGCVGLARAWAPCLRLSGCAGTALFLDLGLMVLFSRRRGAATPLPSPAAQPFSRRP